MNKRRKLGMEESELKGDKVSVRQTEGVAYGYKEGKDRVNEGFAQE